MQHLDQVKAGDLLLLDRGYPIFWLLFLMKAKGIEFCVRLKEDWWLKVKDFTESPEKERIVTFTLPKKDRAKLKDFPNMLDTEKTCRLIKVELETKAVKQDFHAKVFLMTLCAAYAYPIEEKVIKEYKADQTRKYDQKINRTNALATTMEVLIPIF